MYRLTTPTHTFIFEVNPEETFETILITYSQDGRIKLEKNKGDLTFGTISEDSKTLYTASVKLTQEETQKFTASRTVDIQVRAGTSADEWFASDIQFLPVHDVLNDKVLP